MNNNQEIGILDIIFLWNLMINMQQPSNKDLLELEANIEQHLHKIMMQNEKIMKALNIQEEET